ncbi:universal stress protein [Kitasatospora sp. RG8]|uniref:universal stress protein n=1 Tax=Kitasatospora sp. RG8 TaxID=2820815 RepID=UPI001ADEDAC8|nr:universal stress protein [Kitasatospora sp. RG8]MBP0452309.1 universal stress protein [Kitasatospora sp. RG8]
MNGPVTVGVDSSEASQAALDWACDEAALRRLPLRLVRAPELPSGRQEDAALLAVERSRATARRPEVSVTADLVEGKAREVLTEAAADAALLVVGARGSGGFPRLLLGSNTLYVAAHAPCPVVVVRTPQAAPDAAVVVGVEGGEHEEPVLAHAFLAAQRQELPLFAVHAWTYPLLMGPGHEVPVVYEESHIAAEHDRLLTEVLTGWRERFPDVPVTTSVVRSSAARELVAASTGRQLLVIGRHGKPRGPLGRLGSTSQAVVQHAECPVVVVPV